VSRADSSLRGLILDFLKEFGCFAADGGFFGGYLQHPVQPEFRRAEIARVCLDKMPSAADPGSKRSWLSFHPVILHAGSAGNFRVAVMKPAIPNHDVIE
jgi:hypothetical protein